ncbi:hypothetical protein EEB14_52400 [Rhodococcus sp. WS4]|nr:hypothetical protein EEB14_52400 [Rhodococcus sp. WS4]
MTSDASATSSAGAVPPYQVVTRALTTLGHIGIPEVIALVVAYVVKRSARPNVVHPSDEADQ